jgi:hypothetical protein
LIGDWEAEWNENDSEQRNEEATLDRLTAWMRELGSEIALVTTNYDIGLEWEIYRHDSNRRKVYRTIDLGCDWRHIRSGREQTRPSTDHRLRIYKLHGSLDQLRCVNCGYIYFNPWGSRAHPIPGRNWTGGTPVTVATISRLVLNIVAPSLVREIRDPNLLNVWRSALEWLRTAER